MYYASFGILAIIIHIIINFNVMTGRDEETTLYMTRYRYFLYCVLVYYVSDVLWGFLFESRIVPLVYADTVVYFVAMALSILLWSRFVVAYLNRKDFAGKAITHSGTLIFVYLIVSLAVNFFVPVIFSFSEDGTYYPGHARYITMAVQAVFFLMTAIYTFAITLKTSGKARGHHRTIGASGLAMIVFILLQTAYPLLPFYAVGCLIANCLMHSFIEVDEKMEYHHKLGTVKNMVYTDPLTGVKSTHAYVEAKRSIDHLIRDGVRKDFGVVVFDINNLKRINDTQGHEEGDRLIKAACAMICSHFKHSPVFRTGGDEFVIILEGRDYEDREELIGTFDAMIEENMKKGLVVVACGLAVYDHKTDGDFDSVFEQADHNMYRRKKQLKEM